MSEATPVDHAQEAQRQTPQLDALVDSALALFHSRHTYIVTKYGTRQGYISRTAARDAVEKSGFTTNELFSALTRQTSLTPGEIFDDGRDDNTWEELETYASSKIVGLELVKRHPEIEGQDDARLDWESKSHKEWIRRNYSRALSLDDLG